MKRRILVVDDQSDFSFILAFKLRRLFECEVVAAQNGKEGLERMSERDFELIITDLNMPIMNGGEFIHELRVIQGIKIPIILISGANREELKTISQYEGVFVYQKPFGTDLALKKAQELLRGLDKAY